MIDTSLRPIFIRLAVVSALSASAWIGLVKPARASYDHSAGQLAAQEGELGELERRQLDAADLTIARINEIARDLQDRLATSSSSTEVLQRFERLAAQNAVRLRRTEPRGTEQLRTRDAEGQQIFADRYFIEISGAYKDVAGFLTDLATNAGVIDFDQFRLSPSNKPNVTGALDLTVYRLAANESILPPDMDTANAP